MRSRAVSLPRPCWATIRASPPPALARARRASSSDDDILHGTGRLGSGRSDCMRQARDRRTSRAACSISRREAGGPLPRPRGPRPISRPDRLRPGGTARKPPRPIAAHPAPPVPEPASRVIDASTCRAVSSKSSCASTARCSAARASGRLLDMPDAGCHGQPRVMPVRGPIQQVVPVTLARCQLDRCLGPIRQKVILAKAQNGGDDVAARGLHAIKHRIDQPGERHGGRTHLLILVAPFLRDRFGQRLGWAAAAAAAPACCTGLPSSRKRKPPPRLLHRHVLVEALHFVSSCPGKGSRRSSGSKPRSSQLFSICGGKGAVTCKRPPSGRAMSIANGHADEACRRWRLCPWRRCRHI